MIKGLDYVLTDNDLILNVSKNNENEQFFDFLSKLVREDIFIDQIFDDNRSIIMHDKQTRITGTIDLVITEKNAEILKEMIKNNLVINTAAPKENNSQTIQNNNDNLDDISQLEYSDLPTIPKGTRRKNMKMEYFHHLLKCNECGKWLDERQAAAWCNRVYRRVDLSKTTKAELNAKNQIHLCSRNCRNSYLRKLKAEKRIAKIQNNEVNNSSAPITENKEFTEKDIQNLEIKMKQNQIRSPYQGKYGRGHKKDLSPYKNLLKCSNPECNNYLTEKQAYFWFRNNQLKLEDIQDKAILNNGFYRHFCCQKCAKAELSIRYFQKSMRKYPKRSGIYGSRI